jgi:hypothetical protein
MAIDNRLWGAQRIRDEEGEQRHFHPAERLMAAAEAWHGRLARPTVHLELSYSPVCRTPDGTERVFHSDPNSGLHLKLSFPALPAMDDTSTSLLALTWHQDGDANGVSLDGLRHTTFIQLHAMIPPPVD